MIDRGPERKERKFSVLVGGLLRDFETLARQESTLLRTEYIPKNTRRSVLWWAFSIWLSILGSAMLSQGLVYWFKEVFGQPLSFSYAVVGGLLVTVGALAFLRARKKRIL